ncbi:hypothetical protein OAT16_08015 [Prolixibacteraceae bacterium]|nr:hypothetical protein [Prolixibacteraceae bacterium]
MKRDTILFLLLLFSLNAFSQDLKPVKFHKCLESYHNALNDFYKDFPEVGKGLSDSLSNNIIDGRFLFKSVHHNEVMIDVYQVKKLNPNYIAVKNNGTISICDVPVAIVRKGKITYQKVDFIAKEPASQLKKCGCIYFYVSDSTFTFRYADQRDGEVFNTLGLVLFKDSLAQDYFKNNIKIKSYHECGLDEDIEYYEEITHYESIVFGFCNRIIRIEVGGVRNNKKDIEYNYFNKIEALKNDTIFRISYLTNYECLYGYLNGY